MGRFILSAITLVASMQLFAPRGYATTPLGFVEADFHFHAFSLTLDPNRPLLYATTDSGLTIINTDTLTIVNAVPLPSVSYSAAMSIDGNRLYLANGTSHSLFVLDTLTQTLQTSIPTPNLAFGVAVGLSNRLFVAGDSAIKQIDSTTGASVGPDLPVFVYSGDMQVSPDRSTLYYGDYGLSPGSVYKIDVSTTTPTLVWRNSQDIGENGQDVVLSHDGTMLAYVAGYGYQGYKIPNLQTADMSIRGTYATGAYPNALAYSPDDKLAYALHSIYPTSVDVYDTSTSSYLGQFAAADRGNKMIVDRTGQHLFVSFDGTFYGRPDLIVYGTGRVVSEPTGIALVGLGCMVFVVFRPRRRNRPSNAAGNVPTITSDR